ncbi:glutaredoxin-3 [Diorhabda carinulata]|uniref:glutaredoxin-3 n=1 Tax=Diorhabda sublineata TaxID=1163346 RepID=UPI0024E04299|nr:glutaredoxin-3 [Diorhabda sublineata]XP_057666120.1 glutaredoxin-3 [Diorhabda carinulata]
MIVEIKTQTAFDEAIQNSSLSVVHFQADWADQCAQVNELLDALASQQTYSSIKFFSCPAEDLSEVSVKYKIEAVPTVILFKSGKAIEVINGADTAKITELVKKHNNASGDDKGVSLEERLKALINKSKVMLFMKGDRDVPRCGFSKKMIEILNDTKVPYETFDILTDEEVRQGLKTYSEWPTYPQLYVNGELIGGLDIIKEMVESGDLETTLKA